MVESARGRRWVVARTHAGREKWAAENIANQGCAIYCPRVLAPQRRNLGAASLNLVRSEPLFRSYLFVQIQDRWRFILGTFGVVGLVMGADGPAVIPDAIIEELRAREDDEGLVVLPTPPATYAPNQEVRIRSGLHENHVGLYQGTAPHNRVHILMRYLGRELPVLIGRDLIEAA